MSVRPLPPYERILWRGRPSWADHALLFVMMAAATLRGLFALRTEEWLTAALYGAAITMFLGIGALFHYAVLYEITTTRIRIISGLIHTTVREIPLQQIQAITVRRELLNRLFDIGALEIQPQAGATLLLKGVPAPEDLRDQVRVRAGIPLTRQAAAADGGV